MAINDLGLLPTGNNGQSPTVNQPPKPQRRTRTSTSNENEAASPSAKANPQNQKPAKMIIEWEKSRKQRPAVLAEGSDFLLTVIFLARGGRCLAPRPSRADRGARECANPSNWAPFSLEGSLHPQRPRRRQGRVIKRKHCNRSRLPLKHL